MALINLEPSLLQLEYGVQGTINDDEELIDPSLIKNYGLPVSSLDSSLINDETPGTFLIALINRGYKIKIKNQDGLSLAALMSLRFQNEYDDELIEELKNMIKPSVELISNMIIAGMDFEINYMFTCIEKKLLREIYPRVLYLHHEKIFRMSENFWIDLIDEETIKNIRLTFGSKPEWDKHAELFFKGKKVKFKELNRRRTTPEINALYIKYARGVLNFYRQDYFSVMENFAYDKSNDEKQTLISMKKIFQKHRTPASIARFITETLQPDEFVEVLLTTPIFESYSNLDEKEHIKEWKIFKYSEYKINESKVGKKLYYSRLMSIYPFKILDDNSLTVHDYRSTLYPLDVKNENAYRSYKMGYWFFKNYKQMQKFLEEIEMAYHADKSNNLSVNAFSSNNTFSKAIKTDQIFDKYSYYVDELQKNEKNPFDYDSDQEYNISLLTVLRLSLQGVRTNIHTIHDAEYIKETFFRLLSEYKTTIKIPENLVIFVKNVFKYETESFEKRLDPLDFVLIYSIKYRFILKFLSKLLDTGVYKYNHRFQEYILDVLPKHKNDSAYPNKCLASPYFRWAFFSGNFNSCGTGCDWLPDELIREYIQSISEITEIKEKPLGYSIAGCTDMFMLLRRLIPYLLERKKFYYLGYIASFELFKKYLADGLSIRNCYLVFDYDLSKIEKNDLVNGIKPAEGSYETKTTTKKDSEEFIRGILDNKNGTPKENLEFLLKSGKKFCKIEGDCEFLKFYYSYTYDGCSYSDSDTIFFHANPPGITNMKNEINKNNFFCGNFELDFNKPRKLEILNIKGSIAIFLFTFFYQHYDSTDGLLSIEHKIEIEVGVTDEIRNLFL